MPGSGQDVGRPGAGRRRLSVRSRDLPPAARKTQSSGAARLSRGGRLPASKSGDSTSTAPGAPTSRAEPARRGQIPHE